MICTGAFGEDGQEFAEPRQRAAGRYSSAMFSSSHMRTPAHAWASKPRARKSPVPGQRLAGNEVRVEELGQHVDALVHLGHPASKSARARSPLVASAPAGSERQ